MKSEQIGALVLAAVSLACGSPAFAAGPAGDPAKGRIIFARCVACHAMEPGRSKIGPSLFKVFGRKAGEAPGFSYSPVMKSSDVTWTPEALDQFLANPRAFMPGNRMMFVGLSNAADRANVIAYLANPAK